ncbi:MAG TPA: hypothetical protein VKV30_10350 [Candidatus Angelobacter sp.]|nr:hypothetical protein [Candidatus Angelobacter sp.]
MLVLKGYFDGGNQADSQQYDRITLATVCGTLFQWNHLESEWDEALNKHGAQFLHTTNAAGLQKEFSSKKGWTHKKVDSLIFDCVRIIQRHLYVPDGKVDITLPFGNISKPGLMAVTLTIPLKDYKRAQKNNPELPNSVTEICATESLGFCFRWGIKIGTRFYELYFDRNEPFHGHVSDRKRHKRPNKDIALLKRIIHLGESDMRVVPALQVADLFAWCINHNEDVRRSWHHHLHSLPNWGSLILDYNYLMNPKPGVLERMAMWNLPKRKMMR